MEAMDKIRDEMAKNQNPAVQELGETLTAWLSRHPEMEYMLKGGLQDLPGGVPVRWV